jgi:hypothetical protein
MAFARDAAAAAFARDAAAAAAAAQALRRREADEARPLADVTLRAEADGATARAHRGVLATHSRVLKEALLSTPHAEALPLPGKRGAELDVLTAWMYREHKPFTKVRLCARALAPRACGYAVASLTAAHNLLCAAGSRALQENIASVCAMAREYDMPRLMHSVESWLVRATSSGDVLAIRDQIGFCLLTEDCCMEFVRMLSLARDFKLHRFAKSCEAAVGKLNVHQAQQVLNLETSEALALKL